MSAASTLRRAAAAGVSVRLDGDEIVMQAASAPPPDLLHHIVADKGEIVDFLRAEAARDVYEERAAIRQHGGAMTLAEAEAGARADARGELRPEPAPALPGEPPAPSPPSAEQVERLAAAIASDRPWQTTAQPEGMRYWRARARQMLARLDPLARGLLIGHEEAEAKPELAERGVLHRTG